jgi:hypothetical protein
MPSPLNDTIASMNYKKLQEECKKANISAGGAATTLRRRLRVVSGATLDEDVDVDEPARKRLKVVSDDIVCCITQELPFDPVTAEDGRVYERSAIEQHIKGKTRDTLRSPTTNEKMGKRLFPAVQYRNHIQTLIENGVITGNLADIWNTKVQHKKDMEELIQCAESGNANSMKILGHHYLHGAHGFKKDTELGFSWNQRAHLAGDVCGTAVIGHCLSRGIGVAMCHRQGLMYLTMAAAKGSDLAAYWLGQALAGGLYGLPVDTVEAKYWLQHSLSGDCPFSNMLEEYKDKARQKLLENL